MEHSEEIITRVIGELDKAISEQRESTSNLVDSMKDIDKLIDSLENDDGAWLADGLFRPGNSERKANAIASLTELKNTTQNAIELSAKAADTNLPDLRQMANTVKTWPRYFSDIQAVNYTNVTIITDSDSPAITNIMSCSSIALASAWKGLGKLVEVKCSFTKSLVVLQGIGQLVGPIFNAEKRKSTFDKINKEALDNQVVVNAIKADLEELNQSIEKKFAETSTILIEGGFSIKGTLGTHFAIQQSLERATLVIQDWSANYKVMKREIADNEGDEDALTPKQVAASTAKRTIYKEEVVLHVTYDDEKERVSWVKKVYQLTYILDPEPGSEGPGYQALKVVVESSLEPEAKQEEIELIVHEIGKDVKITPEQQNFVLIRTLLILDLNPAQITKIVTKIGVLTAPQVDNKIIEFQKMDVSREVEQLDDMTAVA